MTAFSGFNNVAPNYLRQFPKLPPGYINSTAERIYTTALADWAETTYQPIGVGVYDTGVVTGDLPRVKVADGTIGNKFFGILIHDATYYTFPNQPANTIYGNQLIAVLRQCWDVRVYCDSVASTGDPVYLIHTAAAGEVPGHFKNTAGSNSVQIPGRWIENITTTGTNQAASLELFLPTTRVF